MKVVEEYTSLAIFQNFSSFTSVRMLILDSEQKGDILVEAVGPLLVQKFTISLEKIILVMRHCVVSSTKESTAKTVECSDVFVRIPNKKTPSKESHPETFTRYES